MAKFKILKDGETDIDSADIWRFAFHSDYPTWKISSAGSASISMTPGDYYAEYVVSHNLGYKPIYIANVQYGTRVYSAQADANPINESGYITIPNQGGGNSIIRFYSAVDDNDLMIGVYTADFGSASTTTNYTVYWTLFLDEF